MVPLGGGRPLPVALTEPRVSPVLWGYVRDAQRGAIDAAPDAVRAEPRRLLPIYERAAAPAGPGAVVQWLVDVNLGLAPPLGEELFRSRAGAVADAVADMPAALFTDQTRREAVCTWEFFPGAAAIEALLGARGRELRAVVDALRRVVSTPPPSPPRQPPTPAWRGSARGWRPTMRRRRSVLHRGPRSPPSASCWRATRRSWPGRTPTRRLKCGWRACGGSSGRPLPRRLRLASPGPEARKIKAK